MTEPKKLFIVQSFKNKNLDIEPQNLLNKFKSAFTIYKEELLDSCLLSYLENLDSILRNVLIPKRIIEFTGHHESTTLICLHFCISVQLPKIFGGLEKEAFYIDTNANFSVEKLKDLALDFTKSFSKNVEEFNVDSVLNHIYYTKITNITQLMACLFELDLFLRDKNISLIVINSITFPLRFLEVTERFKVITKLFQKLSDISDKYNIIVIITNFYTTRINENKAYSTASLGDSFYHIVNSRISFSKNDSIFKAKLDKNLLHSESEAYFTM